MAILRHICLIALAASVAFAIAIPSDTSLTKRDPNCDTGPGWAPVLIIGSSDMTGSQCETQFGHDYSPVKAIEVWRRGDADGGRIAGLQFTYASGATSPIYGHEDSAKYPSMTLTLAEGELIKNAILYGDGAGQWLGHIHIETSAQTFDAGRDTSDIEPYGLNVGSGLLLGAVITARASDEGNGEDIANLAFLFLGQPIDHINIKDITFNEDPSGSSTGISPQNVVVGQWYNNGPNTGGYGISPLYSVTSSYSYSQSTAFSFGGSVSVELSAEVFGIGGKVTGEFDWEVSHETATTTATSSTTAVACSASGTLAPSQGVKVTGTYQTGSNTWNYDSTVVVSLKDGSSYQYAEKGKLANVAYSECFTTWETLNDPSIINSPGFIPGPAAT